MTRQQQPHSRFLLARLGRASCVAWAEEDLLSPRSKKAIELEPAALAFLRLCLRASTMTSQYRHNRMSAALREAKSRRAEDRKAEAMEMEGQRLLASGSAGAGYVCVCIMDPPDGDGRNAILTD